MKLYGLIGQTLAHSFSEKYFLEKFRKEQILDCDYRLFPIESVFEITELLNIFPELKGLNVTIPFKEKIIELLDRVDDIAQEVGAVNTIKILFENDKFVLKGYNTDVYGFSKTLEPLIENQNYKALILGTGGAAKAVEYVLKQLNIEYISVTRAPFKNENTIFYSDLNPQILDQYKLIINTTPIGMFPEVNFFPNIPYDYITQNHILYDLIYNPEETQFLKFGRFKKAKIVNGLKMLHLQAEKSWEIFNQLS